MVIGIDGIALSTNYHCGVRHYAENLLTALSQIDRKNTYIIYSSRLVNVPKQSNFILRRVPAPLPFFNRQLFMPMAVRKDQVDVFHYLDPYGFLFFNHSHIVTTVHDLYATNYPEGDSLFYQIQNIFNYCIRTITCNKTNYFITNSNSVFRELDSIISSSQKRHRIYMGVSDQFKAIPHVKKKRILSFQDTSPRKNIQTVVNSFLCLPKSVRNSFILTIIVPDKIVENRLRSVLQSKMNAERFEIYRNIDNERMIRLYNESMCLLYPSLYEGFGMPIIEAMATGCPVITSDRNAMKEISGGCALLVNPLSLTSVSGALRSLLTNKKLYKDLQKKGIKHARLFNWRKTARETLQVYKTGIKKT